jgi:hypothetical protein
LKFAAGRPLPAHQHHTNAAAPPDHNRELPEPLRELDSFCRADSDDKETLLCGMVAALLGLIRRRRL